MTTTLEKKLHSLKRPSSRLRLLLELAKKHGPTDPAKAYTLGQEALNIAESLDNKLGIIDALCVTGYAQYFLNNLDTSVDTLQRAIQLCNDIGDDIRKAKLYYKLKAPLHNQGRYSEALGLLHEGCQILRNQSQELHLALSLYSMAQEYIELSDFHSSLICASEALDIARIIRDIELEQNIVTCIGQLYFYNKDFTQALVEFQYAKSLESLLPLTKNHIYTYSTIIAGIGAVYQQQGLHQLAMKQFTEALELQQQYGEPGAVALTLVELARTRYLENQLNEALTFSSQALLQGHKSQFQYAVFSASIMHARILVTLGRHQEAIPFLTEVTQGMKEAGLAEERHEVFELLFSCYKALGNNDQALHYHILLHQEKVRDFQLKAEKDYELLRLRQSLEQYKLEREQLQQKSISLEQTLQSQNKEITAMGLQIIQEQEFLESLRRQATNISSTIPEVRQQIKQIVNHIEEKIGADTAKTQFNNSLASLEASFQATLPKRYPMLSKTEQKVCSLIKIGLSSKAISDLLYTSIRTVEAHRLNIRKKMGLPAHRDLKEVLDSMGQ